MTTQKWPSIKDVAEALRELNANIDGQCDVRLQVYETLPKDEGQPVWIIRYGSPDYDQDHRGFWGASSIPGVQNGHARRFNSTDVARDLLEQAKDQHAQQ